MKKIFLLIFLSMSLMKVNAQTCSELMSEIKSNYTGFTYNSYTSTAISKVTFYDVKIDYNSYYFAIVTFKENYTTRDYIYQVASNTKLNYSMNYHSSAGEAFHKYIKPYDGNLNCGR